MSACVMRIEEVGGSFVARIYLSIDDLCRGNKPYDVYELNQICTDYETLSYLKDKADMEAAHE